MIGIAHQSLVIWAQRTTFASALALQDSLCHVAETASHSSTNCHRFRCGSAQVGIGCLRSPSDPVIPVYRAAQVA